MQPHYLPSDITLDEIRSAIGENPSWNAVEDYLFENLNDDFSADATRDKVIEWYHCRLNK